MQNDTLRLIAARRSHRAYKPEQLTEEQLTAIMDAALASPSGNNRQPWHFTVVQDQALLDRVNRAAFEAAMARAPETRSPRFAQPTFHVFYHAPTVVFLSAAKESPWEVVDCGIAVQNIAIAAESLGLGSVILGLPREAFSGKDRGELEKALKFPEGYSFVISIAVGTPDDDKAAHEPKPGLIDYIR
ncbi:MAG TPA: nitroreductase [Candidatus Limnocylindria bacterium]|nr:nitroreductase [Candidatus Limnocylindria bacterium]